MDDVVGTDAGALFRPSGGSGHFVVVVACDPVTAKSAIQPVIGAENVKHRRDLDGSIGRRDRLDRNIACQNVGVIGTGVELTKAFATEIGEIDAHDIIVILFEDQTRLEARIGLLGLFLKVPFAVLAPAIADRPVGRDIAAGNLVEGDGFPFGVVVLAQLAVKIIGPQETARYKPAVLFLKLHKHREVAVFAGVIVEILGLPVKVEFAQDHMAKGHGKRRVGPLPGVKPDIAEFGGLGIIGADDGGLGAL